MQKKSEQIEKIKAALSLEQQAELLDDGESGWLNHNGVFSDNPVKAYDGCSISIGAVKAALEALSVSVRYDMLLKKCDITGMPEEYSAGNAENTLPVLLLDYMKFTGIKGVRREVISDYLGVIADENRYNPMLEYLTDGEWDKVDRFQTLYDILGLKESKYMTYLSKWLVQCVALALNDETEPVGCEGVLVLQGEQGTGKTSFFRIITPYPKWFLEGAAIDVSNKDDVIKATSFLITEMGEIDSTLKREQSSLKAFITASVDTNRAPYARNASSAPRRTSFCGTVNPKDYLRDETGSRRYWTIPIEQIDKQALFSLSRDWVHQLWYQVYFLYQQNKNSFRLSDTEMRQLQEDNAAFSVPMRYEEEVRGLLDFDLPVSQWEWWRPCEVAYRVPGNPDVRQIGRVLLKLNGEIEGCIEKQKGGIEGGMGGIKNPTGITIFQKKPKGNIHYLLPMVHFTKMG